MRAAPRRAENSQLLDFFAADDRLNVYAGELDVRPPGAPTTEGLHRSVSLSEAELQLERPTRASGVWRPSLSLPETLDAVRDLRSFVALVRELCDREREGL
jgi:hypothetical protein